MQGDGCRAGDGYRRRIVALATPSGERLHPSPIRLRRLWEQWRPSTHGGSHVQDRSRLCQLCRHRHGRAAAPARVASAGGLDLHRRATPAVVEVATAKVLLRLLAACGAQAFGVRRTRLRDWWRRFQYLRRRLPQPLASPAWSQSDLWGSDVSRGTCRRGRCSPLPPHPKRVATVSGRR